MLEHHAHLAADEVYIRLFAVDEHVFKPHLAGGGCFKQVQATEKSRFAAAGRSDYYNLFALFDGVVDAFQHLQLSAVEILAELLNFYHSF